MSDEHYVDADQLAIGMYVRLDLSWLEHPFTFNSFLIRTDEQIAQLRALGLKQIRIDPRRCSSQPAFPADNVPPNTTAATAATAGTAASAATAATGEAMPRPVPTVPPEKLARIEQNRQLRREIAAVERQAEKAASIVRSLSKQIFSEPERAAGAANKLITDIAGALLANSNVMIHLLNDKAAGEEVYYHSLNVTMLALMLGKALGLDAAALQRVGVGAIFHDIGKEEIPHKILAKTEALTRAEEEFYREHCVIGARMGKQAGLPDPILAVILQHHEKMDGTGYPNALQGEQIAMEARLVAVVNHYDNLCNPVNPEIAMTPYDALSMMFAKRKNWFDNAMLGKLIHVLGVYPPGSVVKLSDGVTGMVLSVNSGRPLRPTVLVYDVSVPKEEAIILDLEQHPQISISKAIRPANLTRSVYDYLSPRKRVTYYFNDKNQAV